MIIFAYLSGALMFFCLFLMIRNMQVYAFKTAVLEIVHIRCLTDIELGKDPEWRREAYEKVSYDYMLYHFWLPLEVKSFWKDDSFLWK